jgi:hypothetical protein
MMFVRSPTTKFGDNAGKIWAALNEKGCLDKTNILKVTQLNEDDLYVGVGWLARENKIHEEDENCYKLDNTNLDYKIGSHAGKVWKILDIWGEADFTTIKRLSDLENDDIHSALGWLACEDKIQENEKQRFTLK